MSPLNWKSGGEKKGLVKELAMLLKDLLGTLFVTVYVQQNETVQTGCGAQPASYSVCAVDSL
jgi:hypothetical protein